MTLSRRSTLSLILLPSAALLLTGCGGVSLDPATHYESIAQLPLWQKLTAIALSTLISEDLACIAAGLLASEGVISLPWAMVGAFLGIYLGDVPLYLIGRLGGLDLLRKRPFRWMIRESQILQAEDLFRSHGGKLIFSSRLLPGSRVPVYIAAGVLNYPFWKFVVFMFLAAALSSVILVWVSMRLGEVVFSWLKVYQAYFFPVVLTVLLLVWLTVKLLEALATKRSRLVLLSRIRRLLGLVRRPRLPR